MWREWDLAVKSVRYGAENGWDWFVGVGEVWEEEKVARGENSAGLFGEAEV